MLPPRQPKTEKRSSRFKCQAHRTWVRQSFACCNCHSNSGVQFAHVRMGSGAGIGQKPDDWRGVPLCSECHLGEQHTKLGEPEFWALYKKKNGQTVYDLIDALCAQSPKKREIAQHRAEVN